MVFEVVNICAELKNKICLMSLPLSHSLSLSLYFSALSFIAGIVALYHFLLARQILSAQVGSRNYFFRLP